MFGSLNAASLAISVIAVECLNQGTLQAREGGQETGHRVVFEVDATCPQPGQLPCTRSPPKHRSPVTTVLFSLQAGEEGAQVEGVRQPWWPAPPMRARAGHEQRHAGGAGGAGGGGAARDETSDSQRD